MADLTFPRESHNELISEDRAKLHGAGFACVVSYHIREPEDVPAVVELFPMNYERKSLRREETNSMILVTRATDNVGRHVVSQLLDTGVCVRGLALNPASAGLPGDVDVMRADLFVPDTLDACLDTVEAIFLIWFFFMAEAAPAFLDAVTKQVRRIVYLSSDGVGDDLEQQTDTFTARIAAKLAA